MEERKENNDQNLEAMNKAILVFLFPALFIAFYLVPKKATKRNSWKVLALPYYVYLLGGLSLIISEFIFIILLKRSISGNFEYLIELIVFYYLLQLPAVLIVANFRLRKVSSDLFLGRLDALSRTYIKNTMIQFGFDQAKEKFRKHNFQIPLLSKTGRAVVGICANTKDYRSRILRKKFPLQNVLSEYLDEELVLANYNSSSPVHQLVIGETGSGKSRLLSRLALAGLVDGWKVVIIDLKGGAEELDLYSTLGQYIPNKQISIKRFPEQPFNLFLGDSEDILKKMLALLPPLTNSPSDFYIFRMMRALNAVINEDSKPPASVEEILHRVKNGMNFASTHLDRAWFASKSQGQVLADILEADIGQCLNPLKSSKKMKLDIGGAWDKSWDICIFSLDGSDRDKVIVADALLTDFDLHLKTQARMNDPRNYLFIVDEAGALNSIGGSRSLLNLISRSRSSGVGLVIASQTLLGLGDMGEEIADSTPIRWMGRLSNPQKMIDLVGTEDVLEATYSYNAGEWNEPSAARTQKAYIVDPDLARRLETFYWNLNLAGKHLWVYAPPLNYKER